MIRTRAWRLVDPVNMVAAFGIASVTGAYLVISAGDIRSGVTARAGESMLFFVPHYLQFVLLEAGILWLLLLAVRADLLLGVPTAVMEMTRAVQESVWKPDYSKSLVPDPAARYPAHYVTPLLGSFVDRLLQPVGNVNAAVPVVPRMREEQKK